MRVHALAADAHPGTAGVLEHANVLVLEQHREGAGVGADGVLGERVGTDAERAEQGDQVAAIENGGGRFHG